MSEYILVNNEWKKATKVHLDGIPVGFSLPFRATQPPYGWLVEDGREISRTTYAKLFSVIGTMYGEGDGETTFNLPNSIGKYTKFGIGEEVGSELEAGLPDIEGAVDIPSYASSNPTATYPSGSLGTVFSDKTSSGFSFSTIVANTTVTLNASRSSSIYGNSDTVTPPSLIALPCIKAFDTIADEVKINLAAELEVLKHSIYRKFNTPYIAKGLPIADKTTITLQPMTLLIDDHIRDINTPIVLELDTLDTAANRKGKDIKVYVRWNNGQLEFKLGYTTPEGFTEANSLLIGGFHCECADVGTIANHPLSGWLAGDILPASVWDMVHRPVSSPDGMVFSDNYVCWYDIYLQSGTLANTKSVFNANTTRSRTQSGHELDMLSVKKRLLTSSEFTDMSLGSNQKTAIQGSKEYANTGGHVDTAGRRMTSNLGCEDANGLVWQWLDDLSYGTTNGPVADTITNMGGVWNTNALIAGGGWGNSVSCGSAARIANNSRLSVTAFLGGRGRSACKSTY